MFLVFKFLMLLLLNNSLPKTFFCYESIMEKKIRHHRLNPATHVRKHGGQKVFSPIRFPPLPSLPSSQPTLFPLNIPIERLYRHPSLDKKIFESIFGMYPIRSNLRYVFNAKMILKEKNVSCFLEPVRYRLLFQFNLLSLFLSRILGLSLSLFVIVFLPIFIFLFVPSFNFHFDSSAFLCQLSFLPQHFWPIFFQYFVFRD